MQDGIDELRSQKRRAGKYSILIAHSSVDGKGVNVKQVCTTKDVSERGLKVVIRKSLPVGEVFSIEVHALKTDSYFKFKGEVKWCFEVDEIPTFFAGIKLIKITENSFDNWVKIARDD